MPLYGYTCTNCGPFQTHGSAKAYDQPAACPICGSASQRMVAAPNLSCTSGAVRQAHERNERSAEQPRVVRREPAESGHSTHHHHRHHHTHPSLPPQAARLGKGLRASSHRSLIGH